MLNEVTRVDPTLVGLVSSQETRTLMHNLNLVMSQGKDGQRERPWDKPTLQILWLGTSL